MELFKKRNLFDIFDIKIGGDVKNINHSKEKTEIYKYPVYSNGVTDEGLFFYSDSYKIEETSITISARGTIGACFYREGKYTSIGRLISLIAKDTNLTNEKYYYYLLNKTKLIPADGVVKSLTKPMLKEVNLYEPKKEEQDKIVNVLDKQQSLIDSYKEKFSLLEEQELYYQDELLSGRIRIKLNSENEKVAIDQGFIVNGELVEGKEKEFEEWLSVDFKDKIDFYKSNNKNWSYITNKELFIKEKKSTIKVKEVTNTGEYPFFNCSETLSKTHNQYINDGEFLLFSTGGKAAVHYYNGKLAYSSDVYCVSINNKVLPYYAYLYWNKNTDIIWKYFEGTGLKHLKKNLFEKEEVFYPENKVEQIFIISLFETVFKQKKIIEEKIKIEEERMDYLMDELLSGRIRVE